MRSERFLGSPHGTLLACSVGFIAAGLSVLALLQVREAVQDIQVVANKTGFEQLLEADTPRINEHIDQRIAAFVQREKQAHIDEKYMAFEQAPENTQSGNHFYGAETAPFTLVVFSDLECPYCKRYHGVPKAVVDAARNAVNWQWKHLPLPMHNPMATQEAQAAECVASIAGNRAFWVFLQEVFEKTEGNGRGAGDLVELAEDIGVDRDAFVKCRDNGEYRQRIASDVKSAQDMGVTSTPMTYVVNNRTGQYIVLGGVVTAEEIVTTLTRMAKQPGPVDHGDNE